MIKDAEVNSFINKCLENRIVVYEGSVYQGEQTTFHLQHPEDMVDYCVRNGINTLIYEEIFTEPAEVKVITKQSIINSITTAFNMRIGRYPFSYTPDEIPKGHFDSVLSYVVGKIKQDPLLSSATNHERHKTFQSQRTEEIEEINFYAVHKDILISTSFSFDTSNDYSDTSEEIDEKEIIKKYSDLLDEKLNEKLIETKEKRAKEKKEHEDSVLNEIEKTVKQYPSLSKLRTQKARYEYADQIYALWYREKGEMWITKMMVRSIVDLQYGYATQIQEQT